MRLEPRPERYTPVPAPASSRFDEAFPPLMMMLGIGLVLGLALGVWIGSAL